MLVGAPTPHDPKVAAATVAAPALIDTGATFSCIDEQFATELGLTPIDIQQTSGAGGVSEHPVYLAVVNIPSLGKSQYGRFMGVRLADGNQHHRVILGRSFLALVVMIYDGTKAQVTLAC